MGPFFSLHVAEKEIVQRRRMGPERPQATHASGKWNVGPERPRLLKSLFLHFHIFSHRSLKGSEGEMLDVPDR